MVFRINSKPLLAIFAISAAAILASSLILFAQWYKNGRGGYESPAMPQYSEGISKHELSENKRLLKNAEQLEQDAMQPLTYMTYRIRPGDMIGFVAERHNVSQDTLISVNNIRATRFIQVGQYIKIPSEEGILYTVKRDGETPASIAKKYDVDGLRCAFVNDLALNTSLNAGDSIFVPGAAMDNITLAEINGDLFRRPLRARYRLTSYFGWRPSPFTGKRSWHGGVDMACPTGTPIYAAMDGWVSETGYNNTYGNYVIINHSSGYKTLYGHMVRIDAKRGQYVTTNSIIGRVGSTGNSTGPHLHFTVFKNGRMVNPIALWG